MAGRSTPLFVFIFLIIITSSSISSIQARKLLNNSAGDAAADSKKAALPTLEDMRLFFNSLPKGKTPSSTPTHKGNSATADRKHIERHLAKLDRILQSVPSPGVGH